MKKRVSMKGIGKMRKQEPGKPTHSARIRVAVARTVGEMVMMWGLALTWSHVAVAANFNFSSTPREDFWAPNGPVHALALQGNTLYLGGQFTSLRRIPQTTGVAVDLGSLTVVPAFPQVKGVVQAVAGDGVGGFYLGGTFTAVGDAARRNLAHVDSLGNVTPWNPGADGPVLALQPGNGVVYVGGEFTQVGTQARRNLASVALSTGLADPWNPQPNSRVRSLLISGNRLFAAGDFDSIGKASRHFLASWNISNETLLPWNPNPQFGRVAAIAALGDTIFVGGDFSSIGGAPRYGLAAITAGSGAALAWNPSGTNSGNSVTALTLSGRTLYAGGTFTNLGGQNRVGLCALNVGSAMATSWNPNPSNIPPATILSLAVGGDTLFVTGVFTNLNSTSVKGFAAIDTGTGLLRSPGFTLFDPGSAAGVSGRKVYLAGAVLDAGVPRRNLAAVDTRTGKPTAWNPQSDGEVFALLVTSNRAYVGGSFSSIGGTNATNLAAVNITTGVADPSWRPNPNGPVLALASSPPGGNTLFAGGDFTLVLGKPRNRAAELDASGALTSWNPSADSTVRALAVAADGSPVLFAGGSFSNIGGTNRDHLAVLSEFTGVALAGNRNADGAVRALAASGGGAFAGGDFTTVAGRSNVSLVFVDQTGTATNPYPIISGSVCSLAASTGSLYVGGLFTSAGGNARSNLASVSLNDRSVSPWGPTTAANVKALVATDDAIYAGGVFRTISGSILSGSAAFAPAQAPIITNQPASQIVGPGETAVLSVGASGDLPLAYQWLLYGAPLAGATNQSLVLPNLSVTNSGAYAVVVSNQFGLVQSEEAIVTVASMPMIVSQPASQTVTAGGTVTLSLLAAGSPTPEVYWRRGGSVLSPRAGTSLILTDVQSDDSGVYDALVINSVGFAVTTAAVVRVSSPSANPLVDNIADALAEVRLGPSGLATNNNSLATAELNEPLHHGLPGGKSMWMAWLATSNGVAEFSSLGSTFDTLVAVYTRDNSGGLTAVASDDDSGGYLAAAVLFNAVAGQTYLVAVDGLQGQTGEMVLRYSLNSLLHIPTITREPTNVVVPEGSPAVFLVEATDDPARLPLHYQWFQGKNAIEGATSATFSIPAAGPDNLGEYAVFVYNNNCEAVQSSRAFLELSSVAGPIRDTKIGRLAPRDAAGLAGSSQFDARELTMEPAPPAFICPRAGPLFRFAGAATPAGYPVTNANLTISTITADVPGDPPPPAGCGTTVFLHYAVAVRTPVPGTFVVRTRGAPVNLSAVKGSLPFFMPLDPPLCATSLGPESNFEAVIRFPMQPDTNYTYSIGAAGTTVARIVEDRILCLPPAATGVGVAYANGGLLLSADGIPQDPLCGRTFQWLTNGTPIPMETNPRILVTSRGPGNLGNLGQYSVIISNCAGVITNIVATLVQLQVYRDTENVVRLRSLPAVTDRFSIEGATELPPPPIWPRFYLKDDTHPLPIPLLPTTPLVTNFFRARPAN